jgi:fatty acid desaturase
MTTTNWSLIHEAIHSLLAPSQKTNDLYGRALSILFGAPFFLLRYPHLQHHRINGTIEDRPEYYDSAKRSRWVAAIRYYLNLLFGIYAVEIAGTFLCLTPRSVLRRVAQLFPKAHPADNSAELFLLKPERLAQIRFDAVLVLLFYATSFWLYGRYWWLLALALAARGILVSVADNSYHYGASLGSGPRSAYNFRFPLGAGILHFNLHRIHHMHPALPWIGLPAAFAADKDRHDIGYVSAMLVQFRGPISDREYPRAV